MFFKYFDIQFSNGKWYAWFFLDLEQTNFFNTAEENLEKGAS